MVLLANRVKVETVQRSAENKGKRKEEGVLERMKGKAEVRVWTLNLKALTGKGRELLV